MIRINPCLRRSLLCFIVLVLGHGLALNQNWHPFPGNGTYLYWFQYQPTDPDTLFFAARMDSVALEGNDSAFYLYRIDRPMLPNETMVTCNGNTIGWDPNSYRSNRDHYFGQKMLMDSNGICRFVSSDADTFLLHTLAPQGATWNWKPGITATVTSIVVAPVLGVMDSIKVISLSNGKTIQLSRKHGFLEVYSFLPFAESYGQYPAMDFYLWGIPNMNLGQDLPHTQEIHDFQVGDKVCRLRDVRENQSYTLDYRNSTYTSTVPCPFPIYGTVEETYHEFHPTPSVVFTSYTPPTAMIPPCTAIDSVDPQLELLPYEHYEDIGSNPRPYWLQTGYKTESNLFHRISANFINYDNTDSCAAYYFLFETYWTMTYVEGLGKFNSHYLFTNEIDSLDYVYAYEKGAEIYGNCEDLHALRVPSSVANTMEVTPNPAMDVVNVKWNPMLPESAINLTLMDIAGKIITQKVAAYEGGSMKMTVTDFPSGIYFLKVDAQGQTLCHRKLVLQH